MEFPPASCSRLPRILVENDDGATPQDAQLGRVGQERVHFRIGKVTLRSAGSAKKRSNFCLAVV